MLFASWLAYDIRMYAIRIYGYVIHEFDPWFNYRATEYLDANGWKAFFHWFDYESWYPLGRPVGTTIYPGMQITSVCLKWLLNTFFSGSGGKLFISLNDVCCLVPAWFGVTATWFLGLFAAECSGSRSAGAAAALIMSIVPAHIMRSVAGGYDNESIAMTAMCMTFFLWVRALRPDPNAAPGTATKSSYIFGVLSGLAYIYMVAAWGGKHARATRAAPGPFTPAAHAAPTHGRIHPPTPHPLTSHPAASRRAQASYSCSTWSVCTLPSSCSSAGTAPRCTARTPSST